MTRNYNVWLKNKKDNEKAYKKLRNMKGVLDCWNMDSKQIRVQLSDNDRPIDKTVEAIERLDYVDHVNDA